MSTNTTNASAEQRLRDLGKNLPCPPSSRRSPGVDNVRLVSGFRPPLAQHIHIHLGCSALAFDTGKFSMIRKARAVWRGSGRAGNGDLSSDSGVLSNTPYSYRTHFENQKGTNPEELIAAAQAGCFTMALAFRLQAAGYTPTELNTEAIVTLKQDNEGFRISLSALTLRASVPNLDQDTFDRLAQDAEQNCLVSRVLKAEITLDARLV